MIGDTDQPFWMRKILDQMHDKIQKPQKAGRKQNRASGELYSIADWAVSFVLQVRRESLFR